MRWRLAILTALLPALLSTAVAGCGGANPAAPAAAIRPGWQPPVRLGPTAGSTTSFPRPTIASDAQGRAIATWIEYTPAGVGGDRYDRADVRAATFEPGGQWRAPALLGDACCGVVSATVVMNRAGDAAVVWSGPYVSFFDPASGWGPPLLTPLYLAQFPSVALAEDGTAVGIGQADDPTVPGSWFEKQRLWGATLSREGWGVPEIISASTAPDYEPLAVGVDGRGNATAIWVESGPPALHHERAALWTNRFLRGVGWGTRERLAPLPHVSGWGGVAMTFDMHPDGHAAAVWRGPEGLEASVYGADGWTPPKVVGDARSADPHVRMLPDGRAIAAWPSYDRGIEAIAFDEGRGWSAPEPLDGRPFPLAGYPNMGLGLGVDESGRAWVVSTQDQRVRAARFSARAGWEPPVLLGVPGVVEESAQVAVSPGGEAFAVWVAGTPANRGDEIWAAVYVPDRR
jgi:hypothetical protein